MLCFILGISRLRLLNNKEKWYVFYIIFLFFIEASTKVILYYFRLPDANFLYPLYIAGDFFILNYLFLRKNSLTSVPVLLILVSVLTFILVNGYLRPMVDNDDVKVISNIIIICLAGYTLIREIKEKHFENRFLFADACIFLYYSVSVFTFIIQQQLSSISQLNASLIWGANNLLSSVMYGSLIYTFLKLKK
ncbi:hypothetical protein QE441_000544 [Chryseobacterium sp. SORGH_AS909]|uniref:YhhN-like protein n=1 Tax=Chryseobacterium camelliae TaxID=1265445 RepID=A0ABU0TK11_9FLAO|nr:hypothetical protein [Chryseobacterium camelliae]MDQ1101305.1 hypothetical protein [Chryseobacterium sp. SORGH_AS_1048]MDR6084750.1 hypothetical protein [Chryseobacterium sp. SORGH_AS_0909]MDR6133023.1 hypothetical protein [Chryseobacterium sp. SORGH_AS_1175]MDT3408771.1 hypothetical protein [Pseudacidovorax intermedius]